MRRTPEEALEFCRDMEMNITTKLRMEGKKNVTTLVTLLRKRIGKMAEKLCHDK